MFLVSCFIFWINNIIIYISKGGEKEHSFEIALGPSSDVAVTQSCVSSNSCTSTSTTSNIAQLTSSVKLDLKLQCDKTDSVKIGIDVMKTTPAATTSDTHFSGPISKEEKTRKLSCWNCQYCVKELFCSSTKHRSQIFEWHCFCSFINEDFESCQSYCKMSKEFQDPID